MNYVLGATAASVCFVAFFCACLGEAVADMATGRKSLLIAGAINAAAWAAVAYFLTEAALAHLDPAIAQTMDIQHGGPICAGILAGVALITALAPVMHHACAKWREKIFVQSVVVSAGLVVGSIFDQLPQDAHGRLTPEGLQRFLSDPSVRPAGVTDTQLDAVRIVAKHFAIVGEVIQTITLEHVPLFAEGFACVMRTQRHIYAVSRSDIDLLTSRAIQRYKAW